MYALTIAGGRGERLRPLTDNLPKSMVPVNDRPLLSYQVEWMRANGVTDVVFLCGYLSEKIQAHFGDGTDHDVRAHYSIEETPLGRGGAVRQGLGMVPEDEDLILVVNGDIITDQPVDELISLHRSKNAVATITVVPHPGQFGTVDIGENGLVTAFREKTDLPIWINAGIYIFSRSILPLLPEKGDHEDTTFPELAAQGRLAALKSAAFWSSVESAKDLRVVSEQLSKGVGSAST